MSLTKVRAKAPDGCRSGGLSWPSGGCFALCLQRLPRPTCWPFPADELRSRQYSMLAWLVADRDL
jgi:hypothetical protein